MLHAKPYETGGWDLLHWDIPIGVHVFFDWQWAGC